MFSIHKDISSKITLYRWDTPTRGGGGVPATFSGTTKANNVRQFGDEAIRDTMRINDDGSLRIPNVNREKHQGIWRCRHHHRANSSSGRNVGKNQVLVKLSVSSRKPSQANKQNRKRKFFTLA